MRFRGFTLIELLIVVAIIAILAAIAVPNFLEAQTRARVTRVKADIRAVATATETYIVDYNVAPLAVSLTDPQKFVMFDSIEPVEGLLPHTITTPISYMSILPKDPFPAKTEDGESPAHTFHYLDRNTARVRNEPELLDEYYEALYNTRNSSSQYWIFSVGPDLEHDEELNGSGQFAAALYDATNGTTSNGDLLYFQGRGW